MINAMLGPDGWQLVAVIACALVALGLAFLCIHWGIWSD